MPYKDPIKQKQAQHAWYLAHKAICRIRGKASLKRTRQTRIDKWYAEIIFCAKHPKKRCRRAYYVSTGARRCSWCLSHRVYDGKLRKRKLSPNIKIQRAWKEVSKRLARKIMANKI